MASVVLKEDKSPIVHNAYCYPELTTFGPEITKKVLKLDCYISVVAVSFKHDRLHAYT